MFEKTVCLAVEDEDKKSKVQKVDANDLMAELEG